MEIVARRYDPATTIFNLVAGALRDRLPRVPFARRVEIDQVWLDRFSPTNVKGTSRRDRVTRDA